MATAFGDLLRGLRQKAQIGLREFSEQVGMDPGNVSRVERGRLRPPDGQEQLSKMALALGLELDSEGWRNFCDVAAVSRGEIPKDILSDQEVAAKLPAFFRTLRGEQVSDETLAALVDKIKRA